MGKIIDGRSLAQKLNSRLGREVKKFPKAWPKPTLAVVLVGNHEASEVYVRQKAKACSAVGIKSVVRLLPSSTSEKKLLRLIDRLNRSKHINGILVQLPLPKQIDPKKVIGHISPDKDVDGFHPNNMGRLFGSNDPNPLLPCTPLGIMALLNSTRVKISGKHAVVVGRSHIVGRPIAELLLQADATVTICHSRTKNLKKHIHHGDIVVAAVGKPHMVKGRWLKKGAIAIDVGISRLGNKRLVGDIDFKTAKKRCSFITPVPGGVGPMTIAMLLANTIKAYKIQKGI
ncbi:MAG: bifunctional 5,10-methylene-tetrahydrofolate dehydrogenase/5,10-methylene-tetrahydrofolate cyclohydrolase [Deltaproteobacteria bacterium RIFCSPHIGHO2_12_FULL_43_9]|nr:MAG: bifunctional 5,10-methylene-tetrahydrofolate dehydrogenase/5,10-methylene-tetrahydrofolate cyclohydrolase [Deltaproteobacteria bacterium RIFCSPHIGHO2_12_FULL_43_9]